MDYRPGNAPDWGYDERSTPFITREEQELRFRHAMQARQQEMMMRDQLTSLPRNPFDAAPPSEPTLESNKRNKLLLLEKV